MRARIEIGPETSEILVDEVRVAGSSGCLVNEVRVGQDL